MTMGNLELVCKYVKNSINDKVALGEDLYNTVLNELNNSEIIGKNELVHSIQNAMKMKNSYTEFRPKFSRNAANHSSNPRYASIKSEYDSSAVETQNITGFGHTRKEYRDYYKENDENRAIVRNMDDKENQEKPSLKYKNNEERKLEYNPAKQIARIAEGKSSKQSYKENQNTRYPNTISKQSKMLWKHSEDKETQSGFANLLKNRFR